MHRGKAHAGAGAVGGRPRQKAPRHRARRGGPGPGDLLRRDVTATGPNRRWVVDFTHVPTRSGFCYTAFVMDLYARRIVGWATSARTGGTDFVLSALEHAIQARKERGGADLEGVVHHCDRGSQYLSIDYTRRLVQEGIEASAGAVGSSYDNAAAEALNKFYKRELVWRDGPWKGRADPGNRDRQMGGLVQPHPPPPHQRRRPPTHDRRTPLQSQPHHHRITNPPQNLGLSKPQISDHHPTNFAETLRVRVTLDMR